jgi:hypothetical protein
MVSMEEILGKRLDREAVRATLEKHLLSVLG